MRSLLKSVALVAAVVVFVVSLLALPLHDLTGLNTFLLFALAFVVYAAVYVALGAVVYFGAVLPKQRINESKSNHPAFKGFRPDFNSFSPTHKGG